MKHRNPIMILLLSLVLVVFLPMVSNGQATKAQKGKSSIHLAANKGDLATLKKMLSKDKKLLNSTNRGGQTALLMVSYRGYTEIVDYLLKKGADVKKQDLFGATALHMASLNGHADIAAKLLAKGADINVRAKNGKVPIQMAFENEHTQVVELFLQKGVDIHRPINEMNQTLLHKAAIMGKTRIVNLLLQKGAKIEQKDKSGRTPLDLALVTDQKNTAKFLKAKGAVAKDQHELHITYVANEGFVIRSGNQGVMIDSLFRYGFGKYHVPSKTVVATMDRKDMPPFNNVKYVLVTHNHQDHFDPGMVEIYMTRNPMVLLISPEQVNDEMNLYGESYAKLKHRMVSVTPVQNAYTSLTIKELKMDVFRLNHANLELENLGYILHMGGKTICHLGDATMKDNGPLFKRFNFKSRDIDVAFIQYNDFMKPENRDIIKETINPKHIVLMHIPPAETARVEKEVEANLNEFPSVTVFTKELQKKVYK